MPHAFKARPKHPVVPVPSFGPRMRCKKCGHLGATAIPNWIERRDYLPGGARFQAPGPYEDIKGK
jgi:hypothetical protein